MPSSSDKKDSLIDLDDQAAGGDADVLNAKFSAMCKFYDAISVDIKFIQIIFSDITIKQNQEHASKS